MEFGISKLVSIFLLHIFYWYIIIMHNGEIHCYVFVHAHDIIMSFGQYHSPAFSLSSFFSCIRKVRLREREGLDQDHTRSQ